MTFSGFRYYSAQTVSPDNEYVFEQVTLCLLITLSLSFFPIRRHLESRRHKHHECLASDEKGRMTMANEPEDISMAMNYAPFIDNAKSNDHGADLLSSCEEQVDLKQDEVHSKTKHDDDDKKAGGNLIKFMSRLGPKGWRKEEKHKRNHSYNNSNEKNYAKSQQLRKEPSYSRNEAIKATYVVPDKQRCKDAPIAMTTEQNEATITYIDSMDASTMMSEFSQELPFFACDGGTMTTAAASAGRNGMAVLVGAEDNFDERERQAIEVLPHLNDRGGWDNIEIYQTSIFQIDPYATRNVLHDASGPFLFECGRCIDKGYESDSSDNGSHPQFLPSEDFDVPDYGTHSWDDLPPDVKLAAETLNIGQTKWEAKIKSKIFKKHWDQLTIAQQAACVQLGLTKRKWEQRFVRDDFQLPTYEGYAWQDLPPNAVAAAQVLGYSQEMWDNNHDSEVCRMSWKELSEEQKAASLALLGFDQVSWDANWLTEKVHQDWKSASTYEHYAWKDLPPKARKAALILGYNEKAWNSNQDTELSMKKWKKLSPEQKAAAFELYGFDQRLWDDQVRYQSLLNTFRWDHLPLDAKSAANDLGYSKDVWDKAKKPSISALKWNMMKPSHRAAWFQLIVSVKAQKEQLLYLQSIQRTQKREASQDPDMQESDFGLEVTKEKRNLLRLAFTAALANIGVPIMQVLVIGMVLGTEGAYIFVAWIMVNFLLDLCEALSAGFIEAEESMCRQAIAVRKYFQAAQQVQLSLGLSTLVVMPIYLVTVLLVDDILAGLSFGDTVAEFARDYAPLAVLSRLIQGCLVNGLNRLMWNDGRGSSMVQLEFLAKFLQFALMLLALVGLQMESIEAIGLIEIVVSILYTVLIYNSCERMGWLEKYEKGLFEYWSLRNKPWAGEFVKMSIPLNTGHILSHCHWFIWTWFAIMMGPAEAAAWIIMQALGVVLVALPTAITNASEIQIGLSIGHGHTDAAKQIALKSLMRVLITSVLTVALLFSLRDPIIGFFTNDWALFIMMKNLVPLVCTGTVIRALASHTQMILGTIGRAKAGIVIFYIGTYCLSLPLACVMVFGAKFGLQSLIMSVVIGNSIIAFANLLAVYSSDWSSMSRTVLMKAEKHCKALIDMTEGHAQSKKELEMC